MSIAKKKKTVLLIVLILFVYSPGCNVIPMTQQPQTQEITPSLTHQPPTATFTPTTLPTHSPTPRATSTSKPSPTNTPETLIPTLTPQPSSTPQQTTKLPNGSFLLTYGAIDIVGTEVFLVQTSQALTLLKDKSPDAYTKIQTYVGIIEQGEHSGMWAYENPPRFEVGQRTADSTTTWYASTIAHDATHSELYHEYLANNGPPVPDDIWISVEAEQFCIAYQLQVLKEIEAPEYEIEYVESQTGDHCDIDDDGDCDWDDYDNRDW